MWYIERVLLGLHHAYIQPAGDAVHEQASQHILSNCPRLHASWCLHVRMAYQTGKLRQARLGQAEQDALLQRVRERKGSARVRQRELQQALAAGVQLFASPASQLHSLLHSLHFVQCLRSR